MKAVYTCKTPKGHLLFVSDNNKTIENIKIQAAEALGVPVLDLLHEQLMPGAGEEDVETTTDETEDEDVETTTVA